MKIIQYQANSIEVIENATNVDGVLIDVRTDQNDIICANGPYESGPKLSELAQHIGEKFAVFKIKSDGIENEIASICQKNKINNYFFLNSSCDARVKMVQNNQSNFAVRCSDYEPIRGSISFAGKADWVWLDTYIHSPLTKENYEIFHKYFKICAAAPDIYDHSESKMEAFKKQIKTFQVDAICTSKPSEWVTP